MTRKRKRVAGGRRRQLLVKLSDDELAGVEEAAERAGMTPTGYTAEAAVLAARGGPGGSEPGALRDLGVQLMQTRTQLSRVGTNLTQAVAKLHTTGESSPGLAAAVDAAHRAIAEVRDTTSVVARTMRR